jgi:hypothetical protein
MNHPGDELDASIPRTLVLSQVTQLRPARTLGHQLTHDIDADHNHSRQPISAVRHVPSEK